MILHIANRLKLIRIMLVFSVVITGYSIDRVRAATCARIHDIQGASHQSPCSGQSVQNVPGIVTGLYYTSGGVAGFYMQDPTPDADPNTSEGILVYAPKTPGIVVGDSVTVGGKVSEYVPGGAAGKNNLTVTEIGGKVTVNVVARGATLPAPVIVGVGGRVPPIQAIEDNPACGDMNTCKLFDPSKEGIDFWESLEGMRVQVNHALVVGPTNKFYETVIVADNGTGAALRTPRGGVIISPTNFNPQRVYLADDTLKGGGAPNSPPMNVGDTIAAVTGVIDYNFGNYRIELTQPISPVSGGLTQGLATAQTTDQLAIATFNVQNLNNSNPPEKFQKLGALVVNNLKSPDIVAVEEVQDNSGVIDDRIVAADQTWKALIDAIHAAGGPSYAFTQIDPVNDQDGGQPGGNIRQGFLYNPVRVKLVGTAGDSITADSVTCTNGAATLALSPGRLAPTDGAWQSSRKPLAAQFSFGGHTVIVIGNHFVAKLSDQPLYGHTQPPQFHSTADRLKQAVLVNAFVGEVIACEATANVVVLGDLNDYQFSTPITTLAGNLLDNLMLTLPTNEQYSYVFDGNSEVLDQILVSHNLTQKAAPAYQVVHINAEFYNDALPGSVRSSDHDPSVVRLTLP